MRYKLCISIGSSFEDVLDFDLTASSEEEAVNDFLIENPVYIGCNFLLTKISNICSEVKQIGSSEASVGALQSI